MVGTQHSVSIAYTKSYSFRIRDHRVQLTGHDMTSIVYGRPNFSIERVLEPNVPVVQYSADAHCKRTVTRRAFISAARALEDGEERENTNSPFNNVIYVLHGGRLLPGR